MTTQDFIKKTYGVRDTSNRPRKCSSVFTDSNGIVYSYGMHYPLAFHVAGLDFINTSGYSNTTSKHISWAWGALEYRAHGVKLWRDEARAIAWESDESKKLEAIMTALKRERDGLVDEMSKKKRKDTMVYADLDRKLESVTSTINMVRASL